MCASPTELIYPQSALNRGWRRISWSICPHNRHTERRLEQQQSPVIPSLHARFFPLTMASSHKRGPWSSQEDSCLMQLVNSHGPFNWVHIAQSLVSRTPKQCRERYHQNLKPTLNHDPITPEEGAQIERLVREVGKRWAEIARRLNNRSDNAVKNWWNGNQNRRRRRGRESHGVHHGIHHEVHHDHLWYQNMARAGVQPSPTVQATTKPIRPPPITLPPPTMSSSSYGYTPLPGHRPQWTEPPLPSPGPSDSAESESGSHYTTSSPAYTSTPLLNPIDLPPVRSWDPINPDRNQLPSIRSFVPRGSIVYQGPQLPLPSFSTQRSASFISRGELPTAPNSPEYHQQQDQKPRGGISNRSKDPRLSVASLLSPESNWTNDASTMDNCVDNTSTVHNWANTTSTV